MKQPENFHKIDGHTFKLKGKEIIVEFDRMVNKIFLFGTGNEWKNTILLEFDFPNEAFNIKICQIGAGDDGWYIIKGATLKKEHIQSIDKFLIFLENIMHVVITSTNLELKEENSGTTEINQSPILHNVLSSDGKTTYDVYDLNDGTGQWSCTCKSFEYSGPKQTCKHIQKIKQNTI